MVSPTPSHEGASAHAKTHREDPNAAGGNTGRCSHWLFPGELPFLLGVAGVL